MENNNKYYLIAKQEVNQLDAFPLGKASEGFEIIDLEKYLYWYDNIKTFSDVRDRATRYESYYEARDAIFELPHKYFILDRNGWGHQISIIEVDEGQPNNEQILHIDDKKYKVIIRRQSSKIEVKEAKTNWETIKKDKHEK